MDRRRTDLYGVSDSDKLEARQAAADEKSAGWIGDRPHQASELREQAPAISRALPACRSAMSPTPSPLTEG